MSFLPFLPFLPVLALFGALAVYLPKADKS